jgi:hypothetical protein
VGLNKGGAIVMRQKLSYRTRAWRGQARAIFFFGCSALAAAAMVNFL